MAKGQQMQVRVVEQAVAQVVDNGNILTPLLRVRDEYLARVVRLTEKAQGHEHKTDVLRTANYYGTQADNVQALINQQ